MSGELAIAAASACAVIRRPALHWNRNRFKNADNLSFLDNLFE